MTTTGGHLLCQIPSEPHDSTGQWSQRPQQLRLLKVSERRTSKLTRWCGTVLIADALSLPAHMHLGLTPLCPKFLSLHGFLTSPPLFRLPEKTALEDLSKAHKTLQGSRLEQDLVNLHDLKDPARANSSDAQGPNRWAEHCKGAKG